VVINNYESLYRAKSYKLQSQDNIHLNRWYWVVVLKQQIILVEWSWSYLIYSMIIMVMDVDDSDMWIF